MACHLEHAIDIEFVRNDSNRVDAIAPRPTGFQADQICADVSNLFTMILGIADLHQPLQLPA